MSLLFKRILKRKDLNPKNYEFACALRDEVDPTLELDFSGYDLLLPNNQYNYFEIYSGNNIIGFVAFFVLKHFYGQLIFATLDNIYLLPKYRGFAGGRVIKEVERLARYKGAEEFWWEPHPDTPMEQCFKNHKEYLKGGCTYIKRFHE